VQALPQTVLAFVRKHELLKPGDRVGVAVSGGADSVALLRLFLQLRHELGVVLSVVHFNHRLRGTESDEDQSFVAELAARHKIEFHCSGGDVVEHGVERRLSLETAAREMRYEWFWRLLRERDLNRIATAHTLDDQAETVVLRLARGAGSRGLAGIYPRLTPANAQFSGSGAAPTIIRPLLSIGRKQLEEYLGQIGQGWREDESNRDPRHARNRVRHGILPCLERDLNPSIREVLAETAEIARAEEDYWTLTADRSLSEAWKSNPKVPGGTIKLAALAGMPLALKRRVVRAAAESLGLRLEFRHVEEILSLSGKPSGSAVLPEGWTVFSTRGELRFVVQQRAQRIREYELRLPIPGRIEIPQLGSCIEALLISTSSAEVYNREQLLCPVRLGKELVVRNWRPGDRFWPAHTKEPRKVKELLQERHLIGSEKKLWPVAVSGEELVWMRGFLPPIRFAAEERATEAVLVRETPLDLRNK